MPSRLPCAKTCLITCALLLAVTAGVQAQEPPRAGLDSPRVRLAVADMRPVGASDALARALTEQLRQSLAAHPQVEIVGGAEVSAATAAAAPDLLALKEGAANALGNALGVDAVVYSTLVGDVNHLLDEPAPVAGLFAQVLVVETLTLEGQVHPGPPVRLHEGTDAGAALAAATLPLLPAAGRVLAIIESPEGREIQLFPVGGRVLAPGAEYTAYSPVLFQLVGDDPDGKGSLLARQDLRPGAVAGRLRTAPQPDGHAVTATSVDPAGRIAAGQLVGVSLLPGHVGPPELPVLLVTAEPADSVVFLNDTVAGLTPLALPLPVGETARVAILHRDHSRAEYEVTARGGEGMALAAVLREIPPFGTLTIATTPPGALIRLGDRELGASPVTARELPAGEHQLSLALEGYRPITHTVAIRRQRTTEVNFNLQKDLRTVRIVSEPEGARVVLDGQAVGTTPLQVDEIQTGRHEIELSLAGHGTVEETFTVRAEEGVQPFTFRMRPLAGNLRIETLPPGAVVTVDGRERGTTPLALTAVSIGQHNVTLTLDGYLPVTRTVEVQDQQTATVQEPLVRAEGSIECVSVPTGARVLLDGQEMGVTPLLLGNVPVGRRVITLSMDGYQEWTARVPVAHRETTRVEVGLIRGR